MLPSLRERKRDSPAQPSHPPPILAIADSSTESARLWQETLAAGGGSFSDRLDVAGRVFVVSMASGSVQYAAMWAVNVSLVAGRRAYGSLRRRFLLQALTDAASRVDKAKAAAKVSARAL